MSIRKGQKTRKPYNPLHMKIAEIDCLLYSCENYAYKYS